MPHPTAQATKIRRLWHDWRQIILYCLIGLSGMTLDFIIFWILVSQYAVNYQLANTLGVIAGISNNFYWNRNYNFKVKSHPFLRYLSFFGVGLLGLALSLILLHILVSNFGFDKITAKIFTIFFVVALQFTLNKYITFSFFRKDNR